MPNTTSIRCKNCPVFTNQPKNDGFSPHNSCKSEVKKIIVKNHSLVKNDGNLFLPPAYVVRREGNSFTLLVCPHLGGGYPYPIMLCNISQNAMGQTPGGGTLPGPAGGGRAGYPARSSRGDTLPRGYPARSSWGGGYPARREGTLPGGVPR